jgi:hypothetical protein
MRLAFILSFAANIILTLVSLAILPERVAVHFGADGMANGWAANWVNALIMTGTHVLLFVSFYFAPHLTLVFPRKLISLPNKEYWLDPERLPATRQKISTAMYRIGVAYFGFMFFLGLLVLDANRSDPVAIDLTLAYAALGLLLGYTTWWTIRFYVAFRLPPELRKR